MNLSQAAGGGGTYRNREIRTVSGTFTVPAGVFRVKLGAQGAGASGMGNGYSTGGGATPDPVFSGCGGIAGAYVSAQIDVTPGDVITYFIGAGGQGRVDTSSTPNQPSGSSGGATTVAIGNKPILLAQGGTFTISPENSSSGGDAAAISPFFELIRGGQARSGQYSGSAVGASGFAGLVPTLYTRFSTGTGSSFFAIPGAAVGSAGAGDGSSLRGGSGGGSSIFGRGGNGGNAGQLGENAPATSYGAGGGGSGGRSALPLVVGGNGANGCLEIYY